jgi:hydrogenase maturation protease
VRLVVYGVEAADLGFGFGLSAPVAAALDELAGAVLDELGTVSGGRGQPR